MITIKVYRIDNIAMIEFDTASNVSAVSGPLHAPGGVKQQPYKQYRSEKFRIEDNKAKHFIVHQWRDYTEEELGENKDDPFQNSGTFDIVGTYSRKIFAYSMEKDDDEDDEGER